MMNCHVLRNPMAQHSRRILRLLRLLAACGAILAGVGSSASASTFGLYEVRPDLAFNFPTTPSLDNRGPTVFDTLPDGRLLILSTLVPDPFGFTGVPELYVETAVGSRTWQSLGALPLASGAGWSAFGGSFLKVSPDGSRVAVGDNDFVSPRVGVLSTSDLLTGGAASTTVNWYNAPHFEAAWFDNRQLAITYAPAANALVSVLDTDSPTAAPVNPDIITGIGGSASGIAFDAAGNLLTGNGFQTTGPSTTGTIKSFSLADWQDALATAMPINFETAGQFFGSALSAGSLVFDNDGNLFVGGGDFFGGGDIDFLAQFQNPADGDGFLTFNPNTSEPNSSYVLGYNQVTGEVYAYEPFALDNTAVYVLLPVPEPSTIVLLAVGAALAMVIFRRRV